MRVHVTDRLPGFLAGVEHDPVSAVSDTLGGGDLVRLGDELVEQAISGAGQGGDIRMMIARDHQDVRGRHGIDVAEGDDPLAVKHHRGRDLPGYDPTEEAVWHTPIIVARRRYAIRTWQGTDPGRRTPAGRGRGAAGGPLACPELIMRKPNITNR